MLQLFSITIKLAAIALLCVILYTQSGGISYQSVYTLGRKLVLTNAIAFKNMQWAKFVLSRAEANLEVKKVAIGDIIVYKVYDKNYHSNPELTVKVSDSIGAKGLIGREEGDLAALDGVPIVILEVRH